MRQNFRRSFNLLIGLFLSSQLFCSPAWAGPFSKKTGDEEKKDPIVIVETNKGNFKILVYRNEVPQTSENFISLVESGFYNGNAFHRYEMGFCLQAGDPTGTGSGGTEKFVPLEINKKLRHNEAGTIGLARPLAERDKGSSQFYITLSPQNGLDDDYAVFAKVVDGLDTIYALRKGDTMTKVYLEGSKEHKEAKENSKADAKEGSKEGSTKSAQKADQ